MLHCNLWISEDYFLTYLENFESYFLTLMAFLKVDVGVHVMEKAHVSSTTMHDDMLQQ